MRAIILSLTVVLLLGWCGLAEAEEIKKGSDPDEVLTMMATVRTASAEIVANMMVPGSPVYQLVSVIWKFTAFVLLVIYVIRWVFGSYALEDVFFFLVVAFLTGAFLFLPYDGETSLFLAIAKSIMKGAEEFDNTVFSYAVSGGSGETVWDTAYFLAVLPFKMTVESGGGFFTILVAAFGAIIMGLLFVLLSAISFLVVLLAQYGLGLTFIIGAMFVPLLMFGFGKVLFFSWVRMVLVFFFTGLFAALILAFIAKLIESYYGFAASTLNPNDLDNVSIVVSVVGLADMAGGIVIALLGIITMTQASSWASAIGGAAVPSGGVAGGMMRYAVLRKFFA